MKHLYSILILLYAMAFNVCAQSITPFDGHFSEIPPKARKAHIKTYNRYEILREYDRFYNYSENGLELEIIDYSGYKFNYTFYPDGKIKSYDDHSSPKEMYYYTEDGKIQKIVDDIKRERIFYYTNNDTDSIISYYYDNILKTKVKDGIDIIKYNSNGYIKESCYYIPEKNQYSELRFTNFLLDSQKRLVKVEYSESDWMDFEYTEKGYIWTKYYDGKPHDRTVCHLNDKGDLIYSTSEFWDEYNIKDWHTESVTEITYEYISTSNENIKPKFNNITILNGSILIKANENENYSIYHIDGRLCKQGTLTSSETTIPLNKGIYIVAVGNKRSKIVIK